MYFIFQTRLVEPVHTSVNRGDCFILVTPDQLFLYIGLYANVIEKYVFLKNNISIRTPLFI